MYHRRNQLVAKFPACHAYIQESVASPKIPGSCRHSATHHTLGHFQGCAPQEVGHKISTASSLQGKQYHTYMCTIEMCGVGVCMFFMLPCAYTKCRDITVPVKNYNGTLKCQLCCPSLTCNCNGTICIYNTSIIANPLGTSQPSLCRFLGMSIHLQGVVTLDLLNTISDIMIHYSFSQNLVCLVCRQICQLFFDHLHNARNVPIQP